MNKQNKKRQKQIHEKVNEIKNDVFEEIKQEIPLPLQKKFNDVKQKVDEAVKNFERRNRVSTTTVILMLSVAGFYDLLQLGLNFIPFIGWIFSGLVGIWSWLTFYVWTSIKGWGFADTLKKWVVSFGLPFLGIVPIANWGPEITIGVFLSIAIVKSDDYLYNKTKGRIDAETIKEGLSFLNVFRNVYNV